MNKKQEMRSQGERGQGRKKTIISFNGAVAPLTAHCPSPNTQYFSSGGVPMQERRPEQCGTVCNVDERAAEGQLPMPSHDMVTLRSEDERRGSTRSSGAMPALEQDRMPR